MSKDGGVDLSKVASPILEPGSTSELSFASNFHQTKQMPCHCQLQTGDVGIFLPFHFHQRGQVLTLESESKSTSIQPS